MVSEKSKKEDKDLEKKEDNLENQENPKEIFEMLDQAEVEIDAVADRAIEETDEITERLQKLGAKQEEIESVLERINKLDDTVEDREAQISKKLFDRIARVYTENFQRIDESIIAEFKMRPIYKKYIQSDKDHTKAYWRRDKNQKKNRIDDSGYDDIPNINSVGGVFDKAEEYKKFPEYITKHKLNQTNTEDLVTYQKNYQNRRKMAFVYEMQGRGQGGDIAERESDILSRLYAIELNQIREKLKNGDSNITENLDAYFMPATEEYHHKQNYRRFNKENSDPRQTSYSMNISHRISSFVKVIENDQIVLSDIQKKLLKKKVVDIIEHSANDLSKHILDGSILHTEKLIDLCEFTEKQKNALNENLFNIILRNKENNPTLFFLRNPKFPYTDDQLNKIFELVREVQISEKGLKTEYFWYGYHNAQKANGEKNHRLVSFDELSEFPFKESQKDLLRQTVFEKNKEHILTLAGSGDFIELIERIKKFDNREESINKFFKVEQNKELVELGISLVPQTAEKYLDAQIADCKNSISNALSLKELLKHTPDEFKAEIGKIADSKRIIWQDDLEKMLTVQERSRRREYDPWINEIDPLVRGQILQGTLSLEKKEDGALLLEYLRKVGAKNLPNYFKLFVNVKRCGSVTEMPQELKDEISKAFNLDVDKLCASDPRNLSLVINELEKSRQSFASALMGENIEVIDRVLKSNIGKEFLFSIKGSSGFGQGGTLEEVLSEYKNSLQKNPELFKLKEGYEIKEVEISEYKEITEENEKDIEERSQIVLSNPDLVGYYNRAYQLMRSIRDESSVLSKISSYNTSINNEFVQELSRKIQEDKISDDIPEEQREIIIAKAEEGLNKQKAILAEKQKTFQEFTPKEGASLIELMEKYNNLIPDNFKSKNDLILALSVQDMGEKFAEPIANLTNKNLFTKKITTEGVSVLTEFVRSHVGEHYLNKKHGEEDAIKTEDKTLLKYLKKAWGTADFDKSILAITDNKLNVLQKGEVSDKKRSITMIPSKGMQRIFSGDLGGACTSRKSLELAKGEYEDLVSYSFVIDKGTPKEKFAGSFLVVEAKTEDDKPILILRANNPQQNVAQIIDINELIEKTIVEVKEVATRRGIPNVGVAYNQGSASNRPFVVDYYRKNFLKENAVQLKKTKETNFNEYEIYKKTGSHFSVLI